MSTSGTATVNFDVTEILQEAWERATAGGDIRAGYQVRTARRSLNLCLMEMANKGLNLFTIEELSIPLIAGQATYNLPLDTIDIIEGVIRTNVGSQIDIGISRVSLPTYANTPNKTTRGRPNQFYVNRQTLPNVTFYLVPDKSSYYTFVYWRLRRVQDAAQGANTMDMPFRFLPMLIAGVAYHLSRKVPDGNLRTDTLKQDFLELMQDAFDEDRDRTSFYLSPMGRMR